MRSRLFNLFSLLVSHYRYIITQSCGWWMGCWAANLLVTLHRSSFFIERHKGGNPSEPFICPWLTVLRPASTPTSLALDEPTKKFSSGRNSTRWSAEFYVSLTLFLIRSTSMAIKHDFQLSVEIIKRNSFRWTNLNSVSLTWLNRSQSFRTSRSVFYDFPF